MRLPALKGDRWLFRGELDAKEDTVIYGESYPRGTQLAGHMIDVQLDGNAKVELYQRCLIMVGVAFLPVSGSDAARTPERFNGASSFGESLKSRLKTLIPATMDAVASDSTTYASEVDYQLSDEDTALLYDPMRINLRRQVRDGVARILDSRILMLGGPETRVWSAAVSGYVYTAHVQLAIPQLINPKGMDFDICAFVTIPYGVGDSEAGINRDDNEYEEGKFFPTTKRYEDLTFLAPMYDTEGYFSQAEGGWNRAHINQWLLKFNVDGTMAHTQYTPTKLWCNVHVQPLVVRHPIMPKVISAGGGGV